jgi:hypothetical protein
MINILRQLALALQSRPATPEEANQLLEAAELIDSLELALSTVAKHATQRQPRQGRVPPS